MVIPLGNEERPRITPWITYLLIGINLISFAWEQVRPLSFLIAYAATPYEITHGIDIYEPFAVRSEPVVVGEFDQPTANAGIFIHQAQGPTPIWLTLISSLFLHANLIHLAGNMLFLSIFGQKVEEAFGRPAYLAFYLGCGIVGTLVQVAAIPESLTPILGASGAVAGVMGAYLVWFPRDRVRVLILNFLVLVPAYAVIGSWIAVQLLGGYFFTEQVAGTSNIAFLAHIGGAATGIVTSLLCWGVRPWQDRERGVDSFDS